MMSGLRSKIHSMILSSGQWGGAWEGILLIVGIVLGLSELVYGAFHAWDLWLFLLIVALA